MSDAPAAPPWRVAITREEDTTGPWHLALEEAGFVAVSCPVAIEGPAPDQDRLAAAAAHLADYDWLICTSARSVRALVEAGWTSAKEGPRFAAVGAVTAAAMAAAGAPQPIVSGTGGAEDLWERLQKADTWPERRVLVATVPGGRRELIDGLRSAGADVDEVQCYTMRTRDASEIKGDWEAGRPDAVLLASPSAANQIVAVVGVDAIRALKAVIPIGRTTAAALASTGIHAEPPSVATFEAIIERLVKIRADDPASPQDLKTSRPQDL